MVIIYTYDSAGQLTGTLLANGMRATYVYDPGGRLTLLANLASGGTTLSSFAYTLGPGGEPDGGGRRGGLADHLVSPLIKK